MRSWILTCVLFSLTSVGLAQQLGSLNDQLFKPFYVNNAVSGTGDNRIFVHRREQWKAFNGPMINALTAEYKLEENPMSFGLNLISKTEGIQTQTKAKLNYTHHLTISDDLQLLFGLSAGMINQKLEPGQLTPNRMDDPVLTSLVERSTTPDLDAGAVLKGKLFQAGIAVNQLQGDMFRKSPGLASSRYYTLTALAKLPLTGDSSIQLIPNAAVRYTEGSPIQYPANVTLSWRDILYAGFTFNAGYGIGMNASVQFKNIVLSYNYDLPVNRIESFLPVAHEFSLGYLLRKNQQSKPARKTSVQQPKPGPKASRKAELQQELQRLTMELSDREEQLMLHEREIFNAIDSLYTKANQQETKTNEEELEKIARTQKEVERIKGELKAYSKEKNADLWMLRKKIEAVRKELKALE